MASRAIRLLLLGITIELFALVFGVGPFAFITIGIFYFLGRLVPFVIGVIGLVVAYVGFSARE